MSCLQFNEGILGIYQTLRDAKLLPQHILRWSAIWHFTVHINWLIGMQTIIPYLDNEILNTVQFCHRLLEGTSAKTSEQSAEQCAMSGTSEEVALIAMRPHVYHQSWSFMLKDISTDQSILSDMEGVCFRTLIIGGSDIANMYHGEWVLFKIN